MSENMDWIFRVGYLMDGAGVIRFDQEVFIKNEKIFSILDCSDSSDSAEETRRSFSAAKRVELPDSVMLPGLINSHHHAYSAMARGIPISESLPDFPAILERLWWKLDRALDEESIRLSALLAAADSVRHGCTTIIDHHSSPSVISGSLDLIAEGFDKLNLSAVLCYEATDRNGKSLFDEAVAENLRFIESVRQHAHFKGMFGLHAPFTLSDESLKRIADVRPDDVPIHIHVAEDRTDIEDARKRSYSGPLARLNSFKLLNKNSLIVHGVHLTDAEVSLAREIGVLIAHTPESNCNNHVGYANPNRFDENQVVLGTDGMSSNLLYSLRFAVMLMSEWSRQDSDCMSYLEKALFENPSRYASDLLGRKAGLIEAGLPADFAIFPYAAPTPVTEENWIYHLVYGLGDKGLASWVFANGKPVLENGVVTAIDESAVYAKSRIAAEKLWSRFKAF